MNPSKRHIMQKEDAHVNTGTQDDPIVVSSCDFHESVFQSHKREGTKASAARFNSEMTGDSSS
jgi:hypothetical protein